MAVVVIETSTVAIPSKQIVVVAVFSYMWEFEKLIVNSRPSRILLIAKRLHDNKPLLLQIANVLKAAALCRDPHYVYNYKEKSPSNQSDGRVP